MRVLAPEDLGRDASASLSSHPRRVRIVGVVVEPPDPSAETLSPVVAAVDGAARAVLALARRSKMKGGEDPG